MIFLLGLFAGSALTILFVAMTSVGEHEKRLEDEEQARWISERRKKNEQI